MDERPTMMAPTMTASARAGAFRIALAGVVALLVSRGWSLPEAGPAYLAAGLAAVFGVLLIWGHPEILLREKLAHTALDSALVGALVAGTGGESSPFFLVYLLAALGVAWIEAPAKVIAAAAALVGSYLLVVAAAGSLGSPPVILRAGFLALFCAAVGLLGSEMQGLKKLAHGLSSTLADEIDRVEKAEGLVARFGPALKVMDLEGVFQWTAEAAHAVGGGSYAHVAALKGNHHRTVMEGDFDACPSWWHPSIQRLVLWSCREGEVVRSGETIHGIEGFVAVPIGPAEGETCGAIVLGGEAFGAAEERALKLLAAGVAPALENMDEAPGGLDQLTGLPNRTSLLRVLGRELSYGGALTVLAVGLNGFRRYTRTLGPAAGDDLLRRIGAKLGSRQRAFRYGTDEFVVVLGGSDEARTRRTALAIRQLVSEEMSRSGHPPSTAAVGFAFARADDEDPDRLLRAALHALEEARGRAEGIAGFEGAPDVSEGGTRVVETARTLIEPLEIRDPYIGDHLRAVSRLALRIGLKMSVPSDQLDALTLGALLHDVGKIGVPDRILQKPGRLTDEEYRIIKRHPVLGARMLASVRELAPVVQAVKHHHERFDGKGYPEGLRGEDIPLAARIISVVDAFDSMVRGRPYGYGITQETALEEIEKNSGTQFDPRVVRALLEVVWELGDRHADSAG
jgi:diguanylate cyclase (GGDEF)-like protein/putative nucleotidyltransferase with HDIG domain